MNALIIFVLSQNDVLERCNGLTFDVGAGGEEAAFACEYREDGLGVLVEVPNSGNGLLKNLAAEGVELLGPVEFDDADLALYLHDDVFVFSLHDGLGNICVPA